MPAVGTKAKNQHHFSSTSTPFLLTYCASFKVSSPLSPVCLQCEENTSLADCSRYLKLPFSKPSLPSNNQTLKGTKESFWITSFLCSTKLTQNGKTTLRDWRLAHSPGEVHLAWLRRWSQIVQCFLLLVLCICTVQQVGNRGITAKDNDHHFTKGKQKW